MAAVANGNVSEFNAEKAKDALKDVLTAFTIQENVTRLEEAKDNAGNDMLKHMQLVFPVATQIEMDVIQNYGFPADGEGVIQFAQAVKQLERDHPEIAELNAEVRAHLIPPMVFPSPPQN